MCVFRCSKVVSHWDMRCCTILLIPNVFFRQLSELPFQGNPGSMLAECSPQTHDYCSLRVHLKTFPQNFPWDVSVPSPSVCTPFDSATHNFSDSQENFFRIFEKLLSGCSCVCSPGVHLLDEVGKAGRLERLDVRSRHRPLKMKDCSVVRGRGENQARR